MLPKSSIGACTAGAPDDQLTINQILQEGGAASRLTIFYLLESLQLEGAGCPAVLLCWNCSHGDSTDRSRGRTADVVHHVLFLQM